MQREIRPKLGGPADPTIRTPQSAHSTNRWRTGGLPGTKFQRKLAVSPQSYVALPQPPNLVVKRQTGFGLGRTERAKLRGYGRCEGGLPSGDKGVKMGLYGQNFHRALLSAQRLKALLEKEWKGSFGRAGRTTHDILALRPSFFRMHAFRPSGANSCLIFRDQGRRPS